MKYPQMEWTKEEEADRSGGVCQSGYPLSRMLIHHEETKVNEIVTKNLKRWIVLNRNALDCTLDMWYYVI